MTTDTENRAAYVAGLRSFADFLENNPHVPLPYEGAEPTPGQRITIHLFANRSDIAAAMRTIRDAADHAHAENLNDSFTRIAGQFAGLHVQGVAFTDDLNPATVEVTS